MKLEEALHQRPEEIGQRRKEHAEERGKVEEHERPRRERCAGIRQEPHLAGRPRERRAVGLHEAVHTAIGIDDLRDERVHRPQVQIEFLDHRHKRDNRHCRAQERTTRARARERTLPPDERNDRREERDGRELERRASVIVERMVKGRRIHHQPGDEQRHGAEDEDERSEEE